MPEGTRAYVAGDNLVFLGKGGEILAAWGYGGRSFDTQCKFPLPSDAAQKWLASKSISDYMILAEWAALSPPVITWAVAWAEHREDEYRSGRQVRLDNALNAAVVP